MTSDNLDRFRVTDESQLVEEVPDLDREEHFWPDGRRMTEEDTAAYTIGRAARGGRPRLGGSQSGSGPSPRVSFRVDPDLKAAVIQLATREGRKESDVAREALEQYVAGHRAAS